MAIEKRIRQRRIKLQLTQQQLADELGVTHQHISRIEQGRVAPSLDLLVKLGSRLGTTPNWLLTGSDSPKMAVAEAIRADDRLSPTAKRNLIGIVNELRR